MPYLDDSPEAGVDTDFHQAFSDFDGWRASLQPGQRDAIDARFRFTPPDQLESERKRVLSVGYVAHKTGLDAEEVSLKFESLYLPAFAKDENGLALPPALVPRDASGFFEATRKKLGDDVDFKKQQGTAYNGGARSALNGEDAVEALAGWQSMVKTSPGYSPKLIPLFLDGYSKTARVIDSHRAEVDGFVKGLQTEMQGGKPDGVAMEAFREKLLDLPDDERQILLHALRVSSEQQGTKGEDKSGVTGFVQQAGEGLARFIAAGSTDQEDVIELIASDGKAPKNAPPITTAAEARAFVKRTELYYRANSSKVVPASARDLSPAERELVDAAKARALKAVDIARQVRAAANATDPTPNFIAANIGPSLALAGAMYVTRGRALPVLAEVYARNNYDQLRLQHPDIDRGTAKTIAYTSGIGEAALDILDINILGKLPTVATLFREGLTKTALSTAARNVGEAYVKENLQEGAQDAVLPLLTNALASDVPSVDWQQDLQDYAAGRADVALAILPLVMVGSGFATVRDIRNARAEFSNAQTLAQAGFVESDRVTILEAARTGSDEVLQGAIQDAMPRRSPEIAAEYGASEQQTGQIEVSKAIDELTRRQGYSLRRNADGWSVSTPNGKSVQTETAAEAVGLMSQHFSETERREALAMARMDEEFSRTGTAFDIRRETLPGTTQTLDERQLTSEQAQEAVETAAALQGIPVDEARKMAWVVLGSSKIEADENVRRGVATTYRGASIVDKLEEEMETRFKLGLEKGYWTRETWAGWVRQAEEITGETYAPAGEMTERQLVEAVSYVVKADVLGRGKDDKRITPGLIREGLLAARARGVESSKEQGGLKAFLSSWHQFFKRVFGTARKLSKARAEGKIGQDWENLMDDLLGVDVQSRYEQEVSDEAAATTGVSTYSLGPFKPLSFITKQLNRRVDEWQATGDAGRQMIHLGMSSPVLQVAGAEARQVMVPPSLFDKVTKDRHAVPVDVLRALPEALADPVAVFQSRTRADSLLVLTEFTEPNEGPILVAITLDKQAGRGLLINEVASLYGKSPSTIAAMFGESVLYENPQKSLVWARQVGQLLPKRGTPSQGQGIVPGPEQVVKWVDDKKGDATHSLAPRSIAARVQTKAEQMDDLQGLDPQARSESGVAGEAADFTQKVGTGDREMETSFSLGRRDAGRLALPDALIATPLGEVRNHPSFESAKAGDTTAAVDVVMDSITDDFAEKVRASLGAERPIVLPVLAIEQTGTNKLPLQGAVLLSQKLGLEYDHKIVQASKANRSSLSGLDRVFRRVEFDGEVAAGQAYLLIDDTLTQGGTLADLAHYITSQGGRVVSVVALTGHNYSAKLALSDSILAQLRSKHGDLEADFKRGTGYGFDGLTESEARTLLKWKPADAVRARILAARDEGSGDSRGSLDKGTAGEESFSLVPRSFAAREQSQAEQMDDLLGLDPQARSESGVATEAQTLVSGTTFSIGQSNTNPIPSRDDRAQSAAPREDSTRRDGERGFLVTDDGRGYRFHHSISEAARAHKFGFAVDVKERDFYDDPGNKLFLGFDDKAGATVTSERDLVSVFKHPACKGDVAALLREAASHALTLDAFDINGKLPELYAAFGFRPAARLAFNREFAPPGWNYEAAGEPDVVFMVRDPEGISGLVKVSTDGYASVRDQVPSVSYDEAVELQRQAANKVKATRETDAGASRVQPGAEQPRADSDPVASPPLAGG